jgi:hypothetical protein
MNSSVRNQKRLFTMVNQLSFATPPSAQDFAMRAGVKRKPDFACQINEGRAGHCNGLNNEP